MQLHTYSIRVSVNVNVILLVCVCVWEGGIKKQITTNKQTNK